MIFEYMITAYPPGEWHRFVKHGEISVLGLNNMFWQREISVIIPKASISAKFSAFREKGNPSHAYTVTGWTDQGDNVLITGTWRAYDFCGGTVNGTAYKSNIINGYSRAPWENIYSVLSETSLFTEDRFAVVLVIDLPDSALTTEIRKRHVLIVKQGGLVANFEFRLSDFSNLRYSVLKRNMKYNNNGVIYSVESVVKVFAVPYEIVSDLPRFYAHRVISNTSTPTWEYECEQVNESFFAVAESDIPDATTPFRTLCIYPEEEKINGKAGTLSITLAASSDNARLFASYLGENKDITDAFSFPCELLSQDDEATKSANAIKAGLSLVSNALAIAKGNYIAGLSGMIGVGTSFSKIPCSVSPASSSFADANIEKGFYHVKEYDSGNTTSDLGELTFIDKTFCETILNVSGNVFELAQRCHAKRLYLSGSFAVSPGENPEAAAECAGELAAGVWIYG